MFRFAKFLFVFDSRDSPELRQVWKTEDPGLR